MGRKPLQVAILVLLAAPSPSVALNVAGLRQKVAAQSRHLGPASGAYVRDLVTGRTVYARRSSRTRSPASNEKLLVTATALLAYGAGTRLRTTVTAPRAPRAGVLRGNIALVGAGDPYLTTGGLRMIASQLRALGIEEIRGGVLGDGSLFDGRRGSYDSGYAYDGDIGGSLGGLVVDGGRGTDPALYAAQRLRDTLLAANIVVRRGARAGRLASGAIALASVPSPTIAAMIARINLPSDNFAAEMLLKDLGAAFGSAGTTTAGATFVRTTLGALGVRARPYDGSGLSRADQVSPRELVDLLTTMAARPEVGTALRASLPVAGRSGTLAGRMRGTVAARRCRAKTGTLRGVSALSGYCDTRGGHTVAFSLIENAMSEYRAKGIEDRIVALIARLSAY